MNTLTNANQRLISFIDLLRNGAGLDISAQIRHSGNTEPSHRPELVVILTGPDSSLLIDSNAELLHAIEHIAAKLLHLEPEEHDRICFDAEDFKVKRDRELHQLAGDAILKVRTTCSAYTFPPMMARERRLLHLALASSGLKSASTGERLHRSVVLYPEGVHPPPEPPSHLVRRNNRP